MTSKANERQVGGNHYQADSHWQHWDMMGELYGHIWFVGCASKYICRFGKKDKGVEGLEKAVHYLEKAEEMAAVKGHTFFSSGAKKWSERGSAAQKLVDTYGIREHDLQQSVRYMMDAINVEELVVARQHIQDFLAVWHAEHTTAPVAHDATFTPPPITGYKVLRGDQVNLMNEIKGTGLVLKDQLDKVIDMYQAEDLADNEGMTLLQRSFNESVQAVIAEDVVPDGEEEQVTEARRRDLIKPFEDETRAALKAYEAPAQARMEGARWLNVARTHLQQGIMAACRAITRPDGF